MPRGNTIDVKINPVNGATNYGKRIKFQKY